MLPALELVLGLGRELEERGVRADRLRGDDGQSQHGVSGNRRAHQ